MSDSLPITITQTAPVATSDWQARADAIMQRANAIAAVSDDSTYRAAAAVVSDLTKHSNALDKDRLAACKPVNDLLKRIKAETDEAREPLESAKRALSKAMTQYATELARRADEEERARAEADAEERRIAEELLGPGAPPPVTVAAPIHQPPKSSHVMQVDRLVMCGVQDIDMVPTQFLALDTAKVNAYLREHRDSILSALRSDPETSIIPGLVIRIETTTQSR